MITLLFRVLTPGAQVGAALPSAAPGAGASGALVPSQQLLSLPCKWHFVEPSCAPCSCLRAPVPGRPLDTVSSQSSRGNPACPSHVHGTGMAVLAPGWATATPALAVFISSTLPKHGLQSP